MENHIVEQLLQGAFFLIYKGDSRKLRVGHEEQGLEKRKHSCIIDYSVVLDVDDCMEEVLKDDKLLCLGVVKFGNVLQFLSYKCGDTNFVYYNVFIERCSRHLYHVFSYPMLLVYMSKRPSLVV